jgi:hypothetical protein
MPSLKPKSRNFWIRQTEAAQQPSNAEHYRSSTRAWKGITAALAACAL